MNIGFLIGLFSLIITCISFGIQIGSNIQMKNDRHKPRKH